MKKLLLFLLTFVATTVAATADEVTFDFKNNEYGLTRQTDNNAPYIDNGTVCQNGAVTMTLFKSGKNGMRLWNDGLRFYKNSTAGFTLSVANGTINSVEITKATSAKFTKEGTETAATSWTNINASEVKFNYSSGSNAALWTVKVTYTPGTSGPELTTATLSFPEKEYSLTFGDEFTVPLLTADPEGALNEVKYSSLQEQIATVDETTGIVTILAVGQTTIRAAISGSETYYDTYAEYTLNVNKPVVEGEKTETFDFSKQGYSNAEELTEVKVNDYITLYFSIGSNASNNSPIYYNKGTAARLYGGNTLNVKGTNAVITSVTFITTGDNKLHSESAASKGILDVAGQCWTGQTKSVTFTQGGTSGHARVQKLEITYILTPAFPKIDGMTEAGTNMPIEAGVTVLTVEVGEGENLHVHEYFGEAQGAPKKISPVVSEDDIDVTSGAWRLLNPDGSVSVEYTVPANVKELHFVAEKKGLVSTPLSLIINEDGTATGIEDIEAAEAEGDTEWYTLQGVRVSAPAAAGLYIRRTAGTVEKVLVK